MVAELMRTYPDGMPAEIHIDFSTLRFIRATGIVFLSNFVRWMALCGCRVYFASTACNSDAVRFLDDAQFFRHHTGSKINHAATVRQTTQPLVEISNDKVHSWLDLTLIPWIATRLSMSRASFSDYKTCISELFNNIKDHTANPIGSIFAQHYPKLNRVSVSVGDWGIGIPATVRTKAPTLTDSDAIRQAVVEGFSAKTQPNNRGAGLSLLLDKVVGQNGGDVTIYSGRGIVRFEPAGTFIQYHTFPETGFCPGTTLEINLRTDTIEAIPDDREDLTW